MSRSRGGPRADAGRIRIIAGGARGQRIAVPSAGTRPTSDRAREALFSALASALGSFDGVRVLDLYSGSGALGLEALSRGAAGATMVEADPAAADVIRANVAALGLAGADVVASTVERFLGSGPTPYDVLLADPPYDTGDDAVVAVLGTAAQRGWLADGATVVVERAREFDWPPDYEAKTSRRYGNSVLNTALWYRRDAVAASTEEAPPELTPGG